MQSKKTIIITTAILILAIFTAGCTDTGGVNPETTTYTPPPEDVSVVSTPAVEVTQDPIVETLPITEPTEIPWYVDGYEFGEADVGTYSNMFGEDIYAVKGASLSGLSYNLFDTQTEGLQILQHQEWTPSMIALYNELSPDQYKALVDQYGSVKSITMETIDLDRDGTMDKVAIHYVGYKGEFNYESDNPKKGVIRLIEDYLDSTKII